MRNSFFYLLVLVVMNFACVKANLQTNYAVPVSETPVEISPNQNNAGNSSVAKTPSSDTQQSNVGKQCYDREDFEVKLLPDLLYRETCSLAGLPKEVSKVINKTAKRKYKEFVVEETIGIDKINPKNPKQRHYLAVHPKDEKGDYSYNSGEQWGFVQTEKGWRLTDYDFEKGK